MIRRTPVIALPAARCGRWLRRSARPRPPCETRWRAEDSRSSRTMATWPFQNTRSPRSRSAVIGVGGDRCPERRFLHVAVARAGHAARRERDLHEAGAIEPERGLAAPQIRHAEKALRHRDEIGFIVADAARDAPPARRRRIASPPCDRRCARRQAVAPNGSASMRRQFDRGARETRRCATPRLCASAQRPAARAHSPAASRHNCRRRAGPRQSLRRSSS